jgi:hypothetical protein
MDTGQECRTCGYLLADRRSLRHQAAAHLAAKPDASAEHRAATGHKLREAVTQQPSQAEHHQDQDQDQEQALEGPPRGAYGCRIFLTGPALTDGLCKPCRREAAAEAATGSHSAAAAVEPVTCAGRDGVPCGRQALPTRTVCARHRAQELDAAEKAGAA